MVTSSLRTTAETTSPSIIEVKASSAAARVISSSALVRTPLPPPGLSRTPTSATIVRTTAWTTVIVPNTAILEQR